MKSNRLLQRADQITPISTTWDKASWLAPNFDQIVATLVSPTLGWLPILSVVSACGLLLLAIANTAARNSREWAPLLFWIALLVLVVPVALRLLMPQTGRREGIGLVVMLGLSLYLVKVLHSPLGFTQHDEFFHWRTANDILRSGQLFRENPLLPATAVFPGMENVTAALVGLGRLPIFVAGVVIVGVARTILILALYLLYEQISGPTRVPAIASIFYMTNPNYLFFLSMFKYQSLAIPFAALVLFFLALRENRSEVGRLGLTAAALLALGVVVTTHHITSYALTAFLFLWTVVCFIRGANRQGRFLAIVTGIALAANVLWLLYVATTTLDYLGPHIQGALAELLNVIGREPDSGRELFGSSLDSGTTSTPLWERMTALAAVALILVGLPFGLLETWQRFRHKPIAIALAVSTLAYPASLALRLTDRGWEIGNRSSEFLFVTIAFVLALAVVRLWRHGDGYGLKLKTTAFALCVSVLFLGGVIAGWKPAWRLPGPYLVDSGTRSIELQGVEAAKWARRYLGPENRMGADKVNLLLMGSYGEQHMSSTSSDGVNVHWILFAPELGTDQMRSLRDGQLRYVVVDRRIFNERRVQDFYPGTPADVALEKFDRTENISRIFDSGDIAVYDVGELSGER